MFCDLHCHSLYSDGSYTPAELIAEAKSKGLVIALTDHNTVSGLPEFLAEAQRLGVTAVPGTELSTCYGKHELHLLGLFIAPEYYDRVERLVKEFHVLKEISNMEMIERLNEAGYAIDYLSVKRRNPREHVNRAHVAAELLEKGYVSSVSEAFATLLGEEHGFYVPPARLTLEEAISFLREIHAIPALAHPLQELSEAELRELLPAAVEAGLLGMEVFHSSYDEKISACAQRIAAEFGLLPCGGSDFHGKNKPDISLGTGRGGMEIPREIYDNLLLRWKSLQKDAL